MRFYCIGCNKEHDIVNSVFIENDRMYSGCYDPVSKQHSKITRGLSRDR